MISMGDAPVPMNTLELNVTNVHMDTIGTFLEHVLKVRILKIEHSLVNKYLSFKTLETTKLSFK